MSGPGNEGWGPQSRLTAEYAAMMEDTRTLSSFQELADRWNGMGCLRGHVRNVIRDILLETRRLETPLQWDIASQGTIYLFPDGTVQGDGEDDFDPQSGTKYLALDLTPERSDGYLMQFCWDTEGHMTDSPRLEQKRG